MANSENLYYENRREINLFVYKENLIRSELHFQQDLGGLGALGASQWVLMGLLLLSLLGKYIQNFPLVAIIFRSILSKTMSGGSLLPNFSYTYFCASV